MAESLPALLDMGFDKETAEKALSESGGNLEAAINSLITMAEGGTGGGGATTNVEESTVEITMGEDPPPDNSAPTGEAAKEKEEEEAGTAEAKSLKCDDCGKMFRTVPEAEFHSAKSSHVNFSESTEEVAPLSAEERKAKFEQLQILLKDKKVKKDKEDRQNAIEMEKKRRMQGQEMVTQQQKKQEKEMQDIVDERKRQKREDFLAKQRVLDQIKADKEARKRESEGLPAPPPAQKPTVVEAPAQRNYDECKLQIRLTNGNVLSHTFGAGEVLAAVRLFIDINRTDGDVPYTLLTPFPRKVFSPEDMETPLKELGLIPSAVLVVTRAVPT